MAAKATTIASSPAEPSIQEQAVKPMMTKVPPRYVRRDVKGVMICNDDNSSTEQLPVIDQQKLLFGYDSELEKLDLECRERILIIIGKFVYQLFLWIN